MSGDAIGKFAHERNLEIVVATLDLQCTKGALLADGELLDGFQLHVYKGYMVHCDHHIIEQEAPIVVCCKTWNDFLDINVGTF